MNLVKRYEYNEYMAHHYAYMGSPEPESYTEAAKDPNWKKTTKEGMYALTENEVWDLVYVPQGVKPIGCWWVYKVKYNANGSINM